MEMCSSSELRLYRRVSAVLRCHHLCGPELEYLLKADIVKFGNLWVHSRLRKKMYCNRLRLFWPFPNLTCSLSAYSPPFGYPPHFHSPPGLSLHSSDVSSPSPSMFTQSPDSRLCIRVPITYLPRPSFCSPLRDHNPCSLFFLSRQLLFFFLTLSNLSFPSFPLLSSNLSLPL